MRSLSRALASMLIGAFLAIAASPARADAVVDLDTDVTVEAATATPGRRGESSRVRFRLVNGGTASLHVVGLSTAIAESASLVARIGAVGTTVLGSVGAPAGETLDLTTSHLWFEISPLARDLTSGESFDVSLNLVGGSIVVPVHVHDAEFGGSPIIQLGLRAGPSSR